MSAPLVLSLFPGADRLGAAFQRAGWCVVHGPERLLGWDVREWHAVPKVFEGIVGGPPCKRWSQLAHIVGHNGYELAPDLIPEYSRICGEAEPKWFLMENVPRAPLPVVPGYVVRDVLVRDVWVGGATNRLRRFSFGTRDGRALHVEQLALHRPDPEPATLASGGGRPVPVAIGGSGKPKRTGRSALNNMGYTNADNVGRALRDAGMPADFFDAIERDVRHKPWTVAGKQSLIGNAVPEAMADAIARAVRAAMYGEQEQVA